MKKTVAAATLALIAAVSARGGDPHEEAQKLIKKLSKDKNAESRSNAAERLGNMEAVEAIPALAAALKDKDSSVRANAAGALLKMAEAEQAKDAMPALQEALLDSDSTTVWNAAGALSNMGTVTTDLMPAYRRLLLDPDCDMKVSAANAISEYAKPEELLPVALDCRNARGADFDFDTSGDARKLMGIVAKDKAAVPLLAERLRSDRDPEVREWAARSLGDLGPAAKPALPALEGALADVEDAVREAAGKALKKVDPRRR
jgi:HEAT repeat protein